MFQTKIYETQLNKILQFWANTRNMSSASVKYNKEYCFQNINNTY